MDNITAAERFLSSTPPGHEWVPLVLIALLLFGALFMERPK